MHKPADVRVLLVGFGVMGKGTHLPVIQNTPNVELVGIVRVHPDTGKIPSFTSLPEALAATHPDLAIISTPHGLHYQQARLCLEYGAHVLVDKPVTLNSADLRLLIDLAAKNHRLLVAGLQRRYEGFATTFRQYHSEGRLGRILLVHGLFAHQFDVAPRSAIVQGWRSDSKQAGYGVIDDSAIHLVDLLVLLSGGGVRNLRANVVSDDHYVHSFTCFFESHQGATVSATASYLAPRNSVQEEVSVWGTEGSLFCRRFCREWNAEAPEVFFKSADGSTSSDVDLSTLPIGRELPLRRVLGFLQGTVAREGLLTEGNQVLDSHIVLDGVRAMVRQRS